MKTSADPRHKLRQKAVRELFAWDFHHIATHMSALTKDVIAHLTTIDTIIERAAPQWPLHQIAKTDLSILRLSIYELLYGKTAPRKVIIDEAVELGKEFGGETSSSFINGVLGTVVRTQKQ